MDSDLSASELRKRYHKGGELDDSQLSASQLRARYGIKSNSKPQKGEEGGSATQGMLLLSIAVAVIAVITAYLMGYITPKPATGS
jgi:hypothetical protein